MAKVIIFDSGVGGFSILHELFNTVSTPTIYLADQANFPYGDKGLAWLKNRLDNIALWAKTQNPTVMVIACNTATVGGIDIMRLHLSCPVVGVEPVVKPASLHTKSLILTTASTATSDRLQNLLSEHVGDISVMAPSGLAQAVENMDFDQVKNILMTVKTQVELQNIQAIGLSCTHYPLVNNIIHDLIPDVVIIDPSQAIARQVHKNLNITTNNQPPTISYLTTGNVLRFNQQIKFYLGVDGHAQGIKL